MPEKNQELGLATIYNAIMEQHGDIAEIKGELKHVAKTSELYEVMGSHVKDYHKNSIAPGMSKKNFGALIGAIVILCSAVAALANALL